ncbi:LysR family transcriptional regulator [Moraxella sp. FZFQ2102]|uniref:helix-turn-helix domain-containing protein n=1 Tax=Moraxella sp. FZFQ2102 TaxID=2953752 RepID=UPI00209C5CE4|nr:LysR family transcriptional regulator [Moraxella sp. FZFQ2102]USZ14334.1 LysR family transcriptional regulator [Moraxella sp. FZFQ2102]
MNVGILSGRIPLISLVQFIAVAEHLNFRHAAKALGISQSSVSARVKALESVTASFGSKVEVWLAPR